MTLRSSTGYKWRLSAVLCPRSGPPAIPTQSLLLPLSNAMPKVFVPKQTLHPRRWWTSLSAPQGSICHSSGTLLRHLLRLGTDLHVETRIAVRGRVSQPSWTWNSMVQPPCPPSEHEYQLISLTFLEFPRFCSRKINFLVIFFKLMF